MVHQQQQVELKRNIAHLIRIAKINVQLVMLAKQPNHHKIITASVAYCYAVASRQLLILGVVRPWS